MKPQSLNCQERNLLIKISITSSVTSIGEYAFNGCSSLNQIAIPSSVTSIGDYDFYGIKSLEIDGNIQNIIERMFRGCSVTSIEVEIIEEGIIILKAEIIGTTHNYIFYHINWKFSF